VRNGLAALGGDGVVGQVLIHDAARPFLPAAVVDRCSTPRGSDGAVPVLPVVDTLAAR
jgi:2-C-methyl-D-erythritol 4-phosphate cytidylyltransferase/2-C-methyl-D-erythritol 2,4-cyclodiphosphate synthase